MEIKINRLLMSKSDFVNKGVTKADLKYDGKQPSTNRKLLKCAITWEKTPERETMSDVAMVCDKSLVRTDRDVVETKMCKGLLYYIGLDEWNVNCPLVLTVFEIGTTVAARSTM